MSYCCFGFSNISLKIRVFLACLHGTYGQNCAMTCGNCLENQTCDNVNGTCTNGCDEGFKDDFCKSGMIELELGFKNSSVFTSKERVVMIIIGGHYLLMSNFLTVLFSPISIK